MMFPSANWAVSGSAPWVMLDGYLTRQDESRGRRLFAFVRSFLIAKKDTTKFVECLTKQSLAGRWLPEKPETHQVFSGEIPWCSVFPRTYAEDMRFVLHEFPVKVRRRQPVFFLDGKEVDIKLLARQIHGLPLLNDETAFTEEELNRMVHRNRMIEVEQIRQETMRFRPVIPVCDLQLDRHDIDDVPIRGITLAKQLAQTADLFNLPQTYDLRSPEGVRVTYGVTFQPQDWNNSERFFYIRETVLRALLKKHGWTLVWAVWGERELSYEQIINARRTCLSFEATSKRSTATKNSFAAIGQADVPCTSTQARQPGSRVSYHTAVALTSIYASDD